MTLTKRISAIETRLAALEAKPAVPALDLELVDETRSMRLHGRWFHFTDPQFRVICLLAARACSEQRWDKR